MPLIKGGSHVLVPGGTGLFPWGSRRNDLVQVSPYIKLYEIELPTDPATRLRMASWPEDVEFGTNSNGVALTYEMASVEHDESRETTSGGLPTATLTISNVRRDIVGYMETHDGLEGQPVRYMLVDSTALEMGQPIRREDYEILSSRVKGSTVTMQLGKPNLQRARFPQQRLSRTCRFPYKSAECGYSGGLATCDKTMNGSDGCVVHANEDRFGGFRSIPKTDGLGT